MTEPQSVVVFRVPMKLRALILLIAAAICLPAVAQERPAAAPRIISSITLPNGSTLAELVALLRKETDRSIVLSPEVAHLQAPDLVLKNVSAIDVLRSVEIVMPMIAVEETGTAPTSVIVIRPLQAHATAPEKRVTRVLKARMSPNDPEALEKLIANLREAVEIAMSAQGRNAGTQSGDPLRIETHRGTALLFVTGAESDVKLAEQVMEAWGFGALGAGEQPAAAVRKEQSSRTAAVDIATAAVPLTLRYVKAADAASAVKSALGGPQGEDVIGKVDPNTNTITIREVGDASRRARLLLAQLDERPLTYEISVKFSKTEAGGAKRDTIAAPKVVTMAGKPAIVRIGDYEIEIVLQPGPMEAFQLAEANRELEQARKALESARAAEQQAVKKIEEYMTKQPRPNPPPAPTPR